MSTPNWNITSDELEKILGDVLLLDVREPEEHAESRIEGCTLIPLGELQQRARAELPDAASPIVVYCAHGVRSLQGVMLLRMLGYANTRSLEGGICAWEEYQASKR